LLDLEVGDVVRLPEKGSGSLYRIERITDGAAREIEARAIEPSIFEHPARDVAAPAAPRLRVQRTALAIKGPNGWEALSFVFAEPVAEPTWRLSKLVRGLGGQDGLAGEVIPAGAPVVLLDAGVVPLITDAGLIGAPQIYRVAAASGGHGDPASIEIRAQASALALLPYAPVRPSARRIGSGIEFAFIRRGRIDSDGWAVLDAPLGEEIEAYEIEIIKQGVVKRVVRASGPQASYFSQHEIEDFGSAQPQISVRIFQMSASVGRGFPCEAVVSIA
jgi:hypothetical protein